MSKDSRIKLLGRNKIRLVIESEDMKIPSLLVASLERETHQFLSSMMVLFG